MIGCTAWLGIKISGNVEVGGNVGCIAIVELRTDWIARVQGGTDLNAWGRHDSRSRRRRNGKIF